MIKVGYIAYWISEFSAPWIISNISIIYAMKLGNEYVNWPITGQGNIQGILPKGPYQPCVTMVGRTLLEGYPRYLVVSLVSCHHQDPCWHIVNGTLRNKFQWHFNQNKSNIKWQYTISCRDKYTCRCLRLWSSWDCEMVNVYMNVQRMETMK